MGMTHAAALADQALSSAYAQRAARLPAWKVYLEYRGRAPLQGILGAGKVPGGEEPGIPSDHVLATFAPSSLKVPRPLTCRVRLHVFINARRFNGRENSGISACLTLGKARSHFDPF